MFAIDHAATALVLKRRFPSVPLLPLLASVQLVELLWVGLNFLGVERTYTEASVAGVRDIHLAHMPWSHSVLSVATIAAVAWLAIARGLKRPMVGRAVALGILSHILLDLLTHGADLPLAPFADAPKLGLGLYTGAPLVAFGVEVAYGVLCWWIFRGRLALLAVIVFFNVANLTMFVEGIAGPERFMAGRPTLVVAVVLAQIAVTLFLVGILARSREGATVPPTRVNAPTRDAA